MVCEIAQCCLGRAKAVSDGIREQFEENPYPGTPLECPLRTDSLTLYSFNVSNAFYARDRAIPDTKNMLLLDAGCGTGYGTLLLALANPGARVVGVDWSTRSLEMATRRREYHHVANVEFRQCSLLDVDRLGMQFDYVNCTDTLYLLPNPADALRALRSVLTPRGIIRADLHNSRQRKSYYRAQEFFSQIGIMSRHSSESVALVRQIYEGLNDRVLLKRETWRRNNVHNDMSVLANHLLRGDRGYTFQELLAIVREADLKLVSMVDACRWDLDALFKRGVCDVPVLLDSARTREDYFLIYDLLNYNFRLYDFWCCDSALEIVSRIDCGTSKALMQLHPLLQFGEARQAFETCARELRELRIGAFVPYLGRNRHLSNSTVACLYPLLTGPHTVKDLARHWRRVQPRSPVDLCRMGMAECERWVRRQLIELERMGVVHVRTPEGDRGSAEKSDAGS